MKKATNWYRIALGWCGVLLLAGTLAGCGDSPTSTPAPTVTPTPAPTPTSAPTPTPATASATAASNPGGAIPVPAGSVLVQIDDVTVQTLLKQAGLPADLAKSLKFNLYASDDAPDKVATDYGQVLTSAGFSAVLPGTSGGLSRQGEQYLGFLIKGNDEVLVGIQPLNNDFLSVAGNAGVPADVVKTLTSQLQGKKSVVLVLTGQGLLQNILGGAGRTSANPTPTK